MNFGPIAKMISGAAAGGGATMFMDFLGTSGIKPAIKMGGSEISLNTVLIMASLNQGSYLIWGRIYFLAISHNVEFIYILAWFYIFF